MLRPFDRLASAAVLLAALTGCRAAEEAPAAAEPPALTTPRLDGMPPDVQVALPARFARALASNYGSFAAISPGDLDSAITRDAGGWSYPWDARQSPVAVLADFDGDGRDDVALLQRSSGGGRAVAVLDTRPAPTVHVFHEWTRSALGETGPTAFYLVRYPAGRHEVPDFDGTGAGTASTVDLPNEGITVSYYGKAATTHYFKDGRFQKMTTAD